MSRAPALWAAIALAFGVVTSFALAAFVPTPAPWAVDLPPALAKALGDETQQQALLAAAVGQAAAPAGQQGYAEVRGGVMYFNPSAQTVGFHPEHRTVLNKRPKAAIPIVDPAEGGGAEAVAVEGGKTANAEE